MSKQTDKTKTAKSPRGKKPLTKLQSLERKFGKAILNFREKQSEYSLSIVNVGHDEAEVNVVIEARMALCQTIHDLNKSIAASESAQEIARLKTERSTTFHEMNRLPTPGLTFEDMDNSQNLSKRKVARPPVFPELELIRAKEAYETAKKDYVEAGGTAKSEDEIAQAYQEISKNMGRKKGDEFVFLDSEVRRYQSKIDKFYTPEEVADRKMKALKGVGKKGRPVLSDEEKYQYYISKRDEFVARIEALEAKLTPHGKLLRQIKLTSDELRDIKKSIRINGETEELLELQEEIENEIISLKAEAGIKTGVSSIDKKYEPAKPGDLRVISYKDALPPIADDSGDVKNVSGDLTQRNKANRMRLEQKELAQAKQLNDLRKKMGLANA